MYNNRDTTIKKTDLTKDPIKKITRAASAQKATLCAILLFFVSKTTKFLQKNFKIPKYLI